MTPYSVSKLNKITEHLKAQVKILEDFGPIAAKRASSGSTELDGFGSGGGGVRGSEVSDPTCAAALGSPQRDEVGMLWASASLDLSVALSALSRATRAANRILDVGESKRGRESSVSACLVCLGPATPARRGMCDKDRKAWERAGCPEVTSYYDRDADGNKRVRLRWVGIDVRRIAS